MTPEEAINIAQNYFESIEQRVMLALHKEAPLIVDFIDLASHNPELADSLLDQFNEYFSFLSQGLQIIANKYREQDTTEEKKPIQICFINLPESRRVLIGNLRSTDLGKLIFTDGKIRTKTDVRPQVVRTRFECPGCGNLITIYQVDNMLKEPHKCSCGRSGKFRILSKEFTDMQRLSIQENFRDLQSGEQPRHIDVIVTGKALTSPIKERRYLPGNLVRVVGTLKESPKYLKTGSQSTTFDIMIESNNIINLDQEAGDIEITKEEEEKILTLSKDPNLYKYIYDSIAPGVLGCDVAKKTAMLFLFNGPHYQTQLERLRGTIHILFIGDPACVAAGTYLTMGDGSFKKIERFGQHHLEELDDVYVQFSRDGKKKDLMAKATTFHKHEQQKTKKITLESGKEIICNYIHPLRVKDKIKKRDGFRWQTINEKWVQAQNLKVGDFVRVMRRIPCLKYKYETFHPGKMRHNAKKIKIPLCNEQVGLLFGLLLGDGNLHMRDYKGERRPYGIAFFGNDEEQDLLVIAKDILKQEFDVSSHIETRKTKQKERMLQGHKIIERQDKRYLIIDSIALSSLISDWMTPHKKCVPEIIMASKKSVVAEFLKGLFSTDGCVFIDNKSGTRTPKPVVQLKQKNKRVLLDVQLLLLKFGITARINEDNLVIRRCDDIILFADEIGFACEKKSKKLEKARAQAELVLNQNKIFFRKTDCERIKKIEEVEVQTVYDVTVDKYHEYISNGIVSHNTGKSKILEYMHTIHPRSGIVEGPGLTAVGLTANVLKDEHFGWILEGGALVLYNGGALIIDELEKATDDAKNALHGPLERNIVSISKANVKADLPSETSLLAAANPKDGTFSEFDEIRTQIDLPDTIFSRFDLVIPFFDRPSEETKAVSKFILKKFENAGKGILREELINKNNPFSDTVFFKKYVLYAMRHCNPIITETKCRALTEFFDKVKGLSDKKSTITLRQMEALIRLTAAHAKIRLAEFATAQDAEFVVQLFKDMYKLFGWDVDVGEVPDIQAIFEAGFTMSKQEQKDSIIHTLRMAFKLNGTKTIMTSLLKTALLDAEIFKTEEEFDNLTDKLIKNGDLYVPKTIEVDGVREEVMGMID